MCKLINPFGEGERGKGEGGRGDGGRKINVKLWTGGHLFDSLQ